MPATLLTAPELGAVLGRFRRTLFRVERLPAYEVASDGGDFARWLDGAPEPTWTRKNAWLDVLRADATLDPPRIRRRVRILSEHPTPYERYSCDWGYRLNAAAGERIRVLRRGEHQIPGGLPDGDWWLVDYAAAVGMHYDDAGRFVGAEVLGPTATERRLDASHVLWALAEPFGRWWDRHPDLHDRDMAA